MTVIKKVDELKSQLGIESNFVIARGEAKEMDVSAYVALAGIHSSMLEITSFAYKFDHPSGEQDIVSSMVGMWDQSQRILQISQSLLG
ncbi:hypothetical protein BZG21_48070, partial [Escherichia coli]|nr:hypothetical protein [Escherichia coli]